MLKKVIANKDEKIKNYVEYKLENLKKEVQEKYLSEEAKNKYEDSSVRNLGVAVNATASTTEAKEEQIKLIEDRIEKMVEKEE